MKRLLCGCISLLFLSLPVYANYADSNGMMKKETTHTKKVKSDDGSSKIKKSTTTTNDDVENAQMQQEKKPSDDAFGMKTETTKKTKTSEDY